jgi:ATP-dependent phosphofructokinase / diphosphate-dependent phosphofructokinase
MKRIGILTGGGDVPGLNVVIKAVVSRAIDSGQEVLGLRNGWQGIVEVQPDDPASVERFTLPLDGEAVRAIDRFGGTILHSSRTNPAQVTDAEIPDHVDASEFAVQAGGTRDVTPLVQRNLEALGVDALVVTGGDDTLGYAARLAEDGFAVVGVPKTMDNDVSGTEYCLGFSTAVTRSVDLINQLRTPAGSHERISIIELFGRNSGATALYVGMMSSVDRVLVSEVPFDVDAITEMLVRDQDRSPSHYSMCVVSEGAHPIGGEIFEDGQADSYGHRKLGGVGDWLAAEVKARSGRATLTQRLAYLMRSGSPDSLDRMVGLAFGNMAYQFLAEGTTGMMTAVVDARYQGVSLARVKEGARPANINDYYDREEYRPQLAQVTGKSILLA